MNAALLNSEKAIEIKDLQKTFGTSSHVLKGVNLSIPKGKITVIIGFSGAGKSVLLKHILGLIKPDSGDIKVLGQDLAGLNEHKLNELRKKFGMLFQSAALFDDMTTIENVMFPIQEFKRKLSLVEVKEIASQRLKVVGLEPEHFNKYPSELSGGMRKRVGLARALALEPEILLYDEPTTGLDPIITEMVDELIVDTHKNHPGVTTVIISHDLPAAFRMSDYIAMLDNGAIRLYGEPEEFFKSDDPFIKKFVSKVKASKSNA
ncbi:MAG: ABC transporter ATP-binding protein [Oligoflexia bacterium]|nr:ABC transporter ATP-binding protein [Oligoflexia bacterium]